MFKLTDITVILSLTTVINFIATSISWQRRKSSSGLYFALGMLGVTFWTLTGALDYGAVPISLKVFFAKLEYTSYNFALVFFALFMLSYVGYGDWLKTVPAKIFFSFIPLSNILLAWTNDWHGWLWSGFALSRFGDNTIIFEHGPGYLWAAITGYLMIMIIIVPLWQASRKGSEFSRRQARLLFFASLIPVIGNLSYLIEAPQFRGIDWTSITFSISSLLFLMALYGTRLLDLVPIARDKLVAGLSDGMIVLDMQDRIIEINQVAADMVQFPSQRLIGKELAEVIPLPQSLSEYSIEGDIRTEFEIGNPRRRYFDVLISPLNEGHKKVVGRLIIFRDITERKQAAADLERRFLEIQDLHRNLQEAQEQLVEQQRALATVEERQRLGRDMHDSVNQSIHSLMLFSETLIALLKRDQTEKAIDVAERIHESGKQALKEIRLLLYETQSVLGNGNADLVSALENRLDMVERRVGIKAEIICESASMDYCPSEWKENLYWIIMEALNNSLKHAKARGVKVIVCCTEKHLRVEVKDDGIGFDTSHVRSGGFGMRTMRERSEILGGELGVQSSLGNGTCVSFMAEIGA